MKKSILSLFVMVSILVGMLSGVSFASTTSYTYAGYVLDAKYNYNFDTGSWYITLKMITENGLVDAYSSVINTPNAVYIQNENITGNRIVSADSIYVGKDVTNTEEYGEVTLGQGNIMLKAKYVELKNSTTIPLGTTLTIGNQE